MLKWLDDNKQWVFSGVGLLGISGFIWVCRGLWAMYNSPKPVSVNPHVEPVIELPPSPPPRRISSVTVAQIDVDFSNSPPLRQPAIGRTYCGLWVNWHTKLWQAFPTDDDATASLLLAVDDSRFRVACEVKQADYVELLHMREGGRIDVTGRIDAVSLGSIKLDAVELTFPPPGPAPVSAPPSPSKVAEFEFLSDHGDALQNALFALAPVLKGLQRTRPVRVLALRDEAAQRRAGLILDWLKVSGYRLMQDTVATFIDFAVRNPGVTLRDAGDHDELFVTSD